MVIRWNIKKPGGAGGRGMIITFGEVESNLDRPTLVEKLTEING